MVHDAACAVSPDQRYGGARGDTVRQVSILLRWNRPSIRRDQTDTCSAIGGLRQVPRNNACILASRGIEVPAPPPSVVIEPDFVFLLYVPDEVRRQRIASRGPITAEQDAFFRMEVERRVMDFYQDLNARVHDNSEPYLSATVAAIRGVIG